MRTDLQLNDDLGFQYRVWHIERMGWIGIALFLIAGLLGVLGGHPFARETSHTKDRSFSIEYDRFARYEGNMEFLVTVQPEKSSGISRLWFDSGYLDSLKILAVSPSPIRGEAREGGRAFVFQTDGNRFTAQLSVQPEAFGLLHGSVWADDGERLILHHVVWP